MAATAAPQAARRPDPALYAMLKEKIGILKQERQAVILAHNYQEGAL